MTFVVGFAPGKDDRASLELAALLARSAGSALRLVTVVPSWWPTPVSGGADREYAAWSRAHGDAAVAEAETLLAEICPDVDAEATWVSGRSISSALVAESERDDSSLVVVGSGTGGGYGHVHLGSTAHVLLHSAAVPVALATRGFTAPEGSTVSRATCAFRGDDVSRRVLARAAGLCAEVGAGLRVATFAVRGRTMFPPETGMRDEDMVMGAWVEQAGSLQEEALGELTSDVAVESVVAHGRSWGAALDRLPWERTEVLVVGSSRSGPASRLFLGSNATKIVRASPVPVIAVPEGQR